MRAGRPFPGGRKRLRVQPESGSDLESLRCFVRLDCGKSGEGVGSD